jgi:hypothetical protein
MLDAHIEHVKYRFSTIVSVATKRPFGALTTNARGGC